MIITKILGGLGNQMFQYAIARAIAVQKEDVCKLDLSGFENYKLHNGYRLDAFDIRAEIASPQEVKMLKGSADLISKIWHKLFRLSSPHYYREKEHTRYDCEVFNQEHIYLEGYWQNAKYFECIRTQLIQDFTIMKSLNDSVKKIKKDIENCSSVSIHVRRGDYLNHPDVGVLEIEYYQRAIEFVSEKVENPRYFVFSNDLEWCKENFRTIKNLTFVEDGSDEFDDLLLMSCCKNNIIANSSFSWWGAWLNINSDKIVVAPKQWMKVNPNGYRWAQDSWKEL
ncbi:alpha-1,2-fucosyltransferase [Corallincola spongiicola]|uniref:Alpha-1,2-fucosyltransferase n=1 Tax=Corallincola spongiicola TaxID=2520508 RepID=A0ABY1WKB3_9GAMM|nr:alpha-1,2-fucosyltransferase [Corallincola spongiicola]TAA39592.1 alpha-1,2-fucosyltransferase [Corallincola spongiicola]